MKEEDMGLHTSVPETRTNLCSFARRFIKIGYISKKLRVILQERKETVFATNNKFQCMYVIFSNSIPN